MDFTNEGTVRQLIEEHEIRDLATFNKRFKHITGVFVEQMLSSERDEHLGSSRYQQTSTPKTNARNGSSTQKVRSIHGAVEKDIPRDREGTFDPIVVFITRETSLKSRIRSSPCTPKG